LDQINKLYRNLILLIHFRFLIKIKIFLFLKNKKYLPGRNDLDVIIPFALTVRMECRSGIARKLELINAVIQPILLNAIHTHGYSIELSIISAITSP